MTRGEVKMPKNRWKRERHMAKAQRKRDKRRPVHQVNLAEYNERKNRRSKRKKAPTLTLAQRKILREFLARRAA